MAMSKAALERAPLRGPIRVAVVLVEFQDVKMKPGTKERMQQLFFSSGELDTGSVTEYYKEVSNGKVTFTGEVFGPYTLSQDLSYYANNEFGWNEPGPNARDMAEEAFDAVKIDAKNADWKVYDNDGNGYVDAFICVHAGQAADETGNAGDIWSMKWVLHGEKEINGSKVYGFLTVSEDAKCGVCAHEIGHLVFGWPDLYDTDDSSAGIGFWCLMSAGSWGQDGLRPVHPSAWCKVSQGWIDALVEKENHQVTLRDVKSSFTAHRLWKNGDVGPEYFLIENRQLTGFDASLPGAGLLVWHVDDRVDSNSNEKHPLVKLVQADGLDELAKKIDFGDAGDPFPGTVKKTTFNVTSTPNSKSYSGRDTFVSITNIPASAWEMRFNITVKPQVNPAPGIGFFNEKTWYRFKNTYKPSSYSLDVINDNGTNSTGNIQLAYDGNFSGQHWQAKPIGDDTYILRTMFLGANRQLGVDGPGRNNPALRNATREYTQQWRITSWGDGTWRIENVYKGRFLCLDTVDGGTVVQLNDVNEGRSTQRWTIEPINEIIDTSFF
jgi:immune inhibitor A